MDRAEGALLVAEKALQEVKRLQQRIAELEAAPKGVVSFMMDAEGNLVSISGEGELKSLGRVRGTDGRDGQDGKDAVSVVDGAVDEHGVLVLSYSDGSSISVGRVVGPRGDKGEVGEKGVPGMDAYSGEAKGLYDPDASYRALDLVSYNGSEWRAKVDNPGPLPGEDWMLGSQRGKRGDRGERGETGREGSSGKDGAQPIALSFDPNVMKFVMVLDDGNQLEADFYPVAEAIRGVLQ